jgi:hypothetical protein
MGLIGLGDPDDCSPCTVASVDLHGSAGLPGIDGVVVDVTGWAEGKGDPSQRPWYQPGAALSLCYFPVAPDVTHAVRDDKALRAQFEESFAPQANMAVVEANWVDGPHDLVLAQIILKGMMPERRMTYIGSLIIPFAACSWVIRMQAVEGPPTGAREVVWLEKYLADGGDFEALGFVERDGPPNPDELVTVRRMPSDDAQWDTLFPQHPLSKVRAWLPECRQTFGVTPEVLALDRFAK